MLDTWVMIILDDQWRFGGAGVRGERRGIMHNCVGAYGETGRAKRKKAKRENGEL